MSPLSFHSQSIPPITTMFESVFLIKIDNILEWDSLPYFSSKCRIFIKEKLAFKVNDKPSFCDVRKRKDALFLFFFQ